MKKNKHSFINIGFSTVTMIFFMICLVTFAALSLLTAHSDYKLSQKAADEITAYYRADAIAKNMLEQIDNKLYGIYQNSSTVSSFYSQVATSDFGAAASSEVQNILLGTEEEYPVISYVVPISGDQNLYVTLKINYPVSGTECFSTITRWQAITEPVLNKPETRSIYSE